MKIHTFSKGINQKGNIIAWLEFKLIYYNVTVPLMCYHTMENPTHGGSVIHSIIWFGLVSLFDGISTLFRLINAKAILLEEQ